MAANDRRLLLASIHDVSPRFESELDQLIDLLSMLEEKTRGNLTAEERQLLDQVIYELRMRYLEAKKAHSPIIQP